MKKIKVLIAAFMVLGVGALTVVPATSTYALDNPLQTVCQNNADSQVCQNDGDDANKLIGMLVNTLLFVVGALSTVMIIVGGIFYVISSGDASKITKAKNTIMYAVVGLVVAFLAFAIINWVLNIFK
jgi:multisubunit Na+/H+ antiporter MnhB subunit